jgi:hypothetical protein
MNSKAPHSKLVIERPSIQLSLESKIYGGGGLLVLSFIVGTLLVSFFPMNKPYSTIAKNSDHHQLQGTSSMKRLPLLIDRVVRDSSAYVYVKHTSIRSELGIPWGESISLKKKSRNL